MLVKLSLLFTFVAVFSQTIAQMDTRQFLAATHIHESDTLPYRFLKPNSADKNEKHPLVIFLHGSGERGTDNQAQLKHIAELFLDPTNRKDFPCYVVAPQCSNKSSWTYPDWYAETPPPMSTVLNMIDSLIKNENIDSTRIYVTGVSMGGYGTWYMLTRAPELIAAAIPICGGGDWARVESFKHIPIWAFHGRKDDVVPVDQTRAMIVSLKKAGAKPRYTEYKNVAHDSWINAYQEPELLQWLFSNRK